MIGFLPTPIPAVQTVGGVARNEPWYDSELEPNVTSVIGNEITNFQDYSTFKTVTPAGNPYLKQLARDSNFSGAGVAGLPQGNQMFAYSWACEIHAMSADLASFDNRFIFEQMNRLRRLSGAILQINQTNAFITRRLIDLLSFEDSMTVQTTHGGTTVMMPFVGDRKGASLTSTQRYRAVVRLRSGKKAPKVVTVKNSPYIMQPLQNIRVTTKTPQLQAAPATSFILTLPLAVVHKFLGILVRGIS